MDLTSENTAIVLDSTSDYPEAPSRFPNMRFVPLYVRFGDDTYRDYVELGPADFFAKLRTSPVLPATSQPTPQDFLDAYGELARYDRIYSLHVSSKVSGTLQSAALAAAELGGDKVRVVDSTTASLAIAMLPHAIQRRLARGTTDEEVEALIERFQRDCAVVFTLETLEYLQRGRPHRARRSPRRIAPERSADPVDRGRGGRRRRARAGAPEGSHRVRAPVRRRDRGPSRAARRDRARRRTRVGGDAERARVAGAAECGDRVHVHARSRGEHSRGTRHRRVLLVPRRRLGGFGEI